MQGQRPRLLFIDDDADLGRLVKKDLECNGYVVEHAVTGAAGLAQLAKGGFDAVALDHHLPGQNGLEVLAAIAQLPEPPPVVFVTGEAEGRVAIAALKAGAVDYVIKEASGEFLSLLRAAIAAAIEARQHQRAREQAETEVRAARDRFEALAQEREMLIQEINHRVANSLQLVSAFLRIQRADVPGEDAKAAFSSAIARVDAIHHVHRQLYAGDNVHAVDVTRYLEHLVADLKQVVTGSAASIRLLVESRPISTTTDRALAIGIIVTELVINALKHAYPEGTPGEVRVRCGRGEDDAIVLAVEDDGRGTPGGQGPESTGLGHRVISMMASKLEASVENEQPAQGTRVVIRIPAEAAPHAAASA